MAIQKRRKNYTDTHVQGSLIRRVLFHWCIFFAVTAIALTTLPALTGDPALPFSERLQAELGKSGILFVVMLGLLPAFMLDTVRFSNRFVGPIARLRGAMRKLSREQQADPIQFRDNDFWTEIANEFNAVSELVANQQNAPEQEPVGSTDASV